MRVVLREKITKLIASGFGLGYIPFASGTFGSLLGVLIYLIVGSSILLIPIGVFLFFLGVYVSTKAEEIYKEKDSHKIVIDEITGFIFAMALLPFSPLNTVIGFILFRIFDVVKPYPAKQFQKINGGFGVMLDDVVAAIYANIVLQIVWCLKIL